MSGRRLVERGQETELANVDEDRTLVRGEAGHTRRCVRFGVRRLLGPVTRGFRERCEDVSGLAAQEGAQLPLEGAVGGHDRPVLLTSAVAEVDRPPWRARSAAARLRI